MNCLRSLAVILMCAAMACASTTLAQKGYSVLPPPQQIALGGGDFRIGPDWHVQLDAGVAADDAAVQALAEGLAERHGLRLAADRKGPVIRLSSRKGTIAPGPSLDGDKDAIAAQAYQIDLDAREIHIAANEGVGLFYGVQMLVQLIKDRDGKLWLTAGRITDWPDLQRRCLYWDDAHHLERLEALKQAIRQAAFFKINDFVIKLDGHFQYRSAPALVEPQALSPAEFQQLTDYALRRHVKLIPYLDGPAHVAFILKHPEYAGLRAFPDSNYEMCTCNPETYKLLFGMYQDLLDANKGVDYFYLSTDEPYYVGMAGEPRCDEAARQRALGSAGKVLAEFISKTAGYLHDHGRTVVFWGEFPMKPADVQSLPAYLVNGEIGPADFNTACKSHGIRQMFYTSTEGEEKLFPDYFSLPASRRLHPDSEAKPRIADAIKLITSDPARQDSNLMGMLVAGWADMGLHPETFWLGYSTIAAAGWNPRVDADSATADFFRLFYGPSAKNMDRVYRLMSFQAQAWSDSWETGPTKARKGIWGNSNSIFEPRHPAQDQFIALPPIPSPDDLAADPDWSKSNAKRLQLVDAAMGENDELLELLRYNLDHVEFQRPNLKIFVAIAQLYRQNFLMLKEISRMNDLIQVAHDSTKSNQAPEAVAKLDEALGLSRDIRQQRNDALRDATAAWYTTWLPRVARANGRTFLHELDDVKDHLPDRTIGMEYLVYRELLLPFDKWYEQVTAARNSYAKSHGLAVRNSALNWSDTN